MSINDQTWCSRNTAFLKTWKNGDLPKRVPFCKSNDRDFVISVNSGFCEVPSNGIATSRWTFCTSLTHFFHPSPVSNLGFSGFVLHGLVWKSGIPFYPLPGHWRGIPHFLDTSISLYSLYCVDGRGHSSSEVEKQDWLHTIATIISGAWTASDQRVLGMVPNMWNVPMHTDGHCVKCKNVGPKKWYHVPSDKLA